MAPYGGLGEREMSKHEMPTGRQMLDAIIKRPELHDFFADCMFGALDLLHMLATHPESDATEAVIGLKTDSLIFVGPVSIFPSGVAFVLEQVIDEVEEIDFGILDKDNPHLLKMFKEFQNDQRTESIINRAEEQPPSGTVH